MVRCDTAGRVLACLHQQQRNPHVPNKPTKHPGTDSPHMCQRVPSQLAPEPLKINEQRHRGFQDLPRRPYGAHRQTRHTRQLKEEREHPGPYITRDTHAPRARLIDARPMAVGLPKRYTNSKRDIPPKNLGCRGGQSTLLHPWSAMLVKGGTYIPPIV